MKGNGLGFLGKSENCGGAIFYEAETKVEDAEGVTLVERGGVGGGGEVGGLGGDDWEETEDHGEAEGEQVRRD